MELLGMPDFLSKLSGTPNSKLIEPREIFMSLPSKDKRYEYPRDVQSEVWKQWFDKRNEKNTIIKMNTGSGKTVVGLMILQSCLNEGQGPAIYVVHDNYLVSQVCDEAKKIGIMAVTDRDDFHYAENKALLVIPIHTLVNGRSVFGMRTGANYSIGSILLDDVHACLNKITDQFTLKIPSAHELYNKLISIFSSSWKSYNSNSYNDIVVLQDPTRNTLLPFWLWHEKQEEVYNLIRQYENDSEENKFIYFKFPLLQDYLNICNCVISSRYIEITPNGLPISKISSFENAPRRIFMSATLSDDSVFVSALGIKPEMMSNIISPDKANDLGDRLILFPKHLNSLVTDDQIKQKISSIAETYNVVVIVPSTERGLFWDESGKRLVKKENIGTAVECLKGGHVGLVVLINRYDGVDLPDDACRLLVIDGLPPLGSEHDKYVQSINPSSKIFLREQVQKIEQGMGRGVRSNSDSCCIVLMGNKLADVLIRNNGISYFSNATLAQYYLSKELWEILKQSIPNPSIEDIFNLAEYSLGRSVEWIEKSKERLSSVQYNKTPSFDNTTIALRTAHEQSVIGQWQNAINQLDAVINIETDDKTKGYLLQIKAEYTYFLDQQRAQQILFTAKRYNQGVLSPISGIQYEKRSNNIEQSKAIVRYLERISSNRNECAIHINSVMDSLQFSPDADDFESTLQETGEILGFVSSRPDKETSGIGPDNLWALPDNTYLVIECKSGAICETISKEYCNQLGGSVRWFYDEYNHDPICIPIIVHKSNIIDKMATPVEGMRVITMELLEKLKMKIRDFTIALVQNDNWNDELKINTLIQTYKLRKQDITEEYTKVFRLSGS